MSNNHSSTTARPDAWQATDHPLPAVDTTRLEQSVDDACALIDRLRERLEIERATKDELLAACKGFVAM